MNMTSPSSAKTFYLNPETRTQTLKLAPGRARRDHAYVYEAGEKHAINAAIACDRALLVRGEPGTGKTELAASVAAELGFDLEVEVFSAASEPKDALYRIDYAARLAQAQVAAALCPGMTGDDLHQELSKRLHLRCFTNPGALWRALAPDSARACGTGPKPDTPPGKGVVVLLDEIDKAPPEVPAALLDVLGSRDFVGPDGECVLREPRPAVVIIASNEERSLPDAFLRRTVVLTKTVPDEFEAFQTFMRDRADAHASGLEDDEIEEAIGWLWKARDRAFEAGDEYTPGCAELVDCLRAYAALKVSKYAHPPLETLSQSFFAKHRRERERRTRAAGGSA